MNKEFKEGTPVQPVLRLKPEQIESLHEASLSLLNKPGITCYSPAAAELLDEAGCDVSSSREGDGARQVRFPRKVVDDALRQAPEEVILGARNPQNSLLLNAHNPTVYFGTGAETNIFLETELEEFIKKDDPSLTTRHPLHKTKQGSLKFLCQSAKLCNQLLHLDFFIRNVNIQDEDINTQNKDVNVFLASLMFMTKHVQSGITQLERLNDVIKLAEIVAGGEAKLRENPVISFITCLVKSPLQMVGETAEKLMAIAKTGMPVVISSSPQGGSTAPIEEEGIVALINAEILAGITLAQMVNPGTPVLYGSVPVRARLDTLHDLYGAPEFIHYNVDCVQMARHYGIPCYSSAGVGDARVPGLQATIEKVFSQLCVAASGAQYIHYAFGLLDRTNVFSPVQAVLDDAHIGMVKQILRKPVFEQKDTEAAVSEIKKVTGSRTKLFARHIRKAKRKGLVSPPYLFESPEAEDNAVQNAFFQLQKILESQDEGLPDSLIEDIYEKIPGLLPRDRFEPLAGPSQ